MARSPKHELERLDVLVNESRRVRQLVRTRGRRAEPEGSVGLERLRELVEGVSQWGRRPFRRIVGSVRRERSRFGGERLNLARHYRAIGDDGVERDERAAGEIGQLGGP